VFKTPLSIEHFLLLVVIAIGATMGWEAWKDSEKPSRPVGKSQAEQPDWHNVSTPTNSMTNLRSLSTPPQ
jgi:hypothetical protein